MSKITIPRASSNERVVIRSTRKSTEYWQCGMFVSGVDNATHYISEDEANKVISLRQLRGVEVVSL